VSHRSPWYSFPIGLGSYPPTAANVLPDDPFFLPPSSFSGGGGLAPLLFGLSARWICPRPSLRKPRILCSFLGCQNRRQHSPPRLVRCVTSIVRLRGTFLLRLGTIFLVAFFERMAYPSFLLAMVFSIFLPFSHLSSSKCHAFTSFFFIDFRKSFRLTPVCRALFFKIPTLSYL